MRTAIVIPDEVLAGADELARELGISRSQLYTTAIAEYVAKFQARGITERLNEVYADEDSGVPWALRKAQAVAIEEKDLEMEQ